MNWLRRILIKSGVVTPMPHEKAELGSGVWGRQPNVEAKTKAIATIKMRVQRTDDGPWEEVN